MIGFLTCSMLVIFIFRREIARPLLYQYCLFSADIEKIEILVSKANLKTLDSLRSDALQNKQVKPNHKHYVQAIGIFKKDSFKLKIRLKGDKIDHYQSDPPSYRIKVLDNKMIKGTNKFSIQSFDTRNFSQEWIYHKILAQQDVLSLFSDVIRLCIDNSDVIYSFEEHFTHSITDRSGRPRGPIICISENLFWINKLSPDSVQKFTQKEIYLKSPIKQLKYYAPLDDVDIERACDLLDDFRTKKKKTSEVFNVSKLAIHFATADLTNSHHALRWHNNRFYYNPEVGKLEPIGFDGTSWKPLTSFAFDDEFLSSIKWSEMFSDQEFAKAYLHQLNLMSQPEFLDHFFQQYQDELSELESKTYRYRYFHPNYKILYQNAEWIRAHLPDLKASLMDLNKCTKDHYPK